MSAVQLSDCTWEEIAALPRERLLTIIPIGATEAHGPHLPLATDVIIAEAMAREAAARLAKRNVDTLLAPPLAYTSAGYAAGFAGTVSIQPDTATRLLVDIVRALSSHGLNVVALANAHLEPAHIVSIQRAVAELASSTDIRVIFPDVTRKPWALRLTDEFKSGACHAGQYEGSIVMAERPELVREELRRDLPDNPASLSRAIRDGKTSFEAAGGPRAYFGYPARASAEEGTRTVGVLAGILEEAVISETGW